MEFVDGKSVADELTESGALSWERSLGGPSRSQNPVGRGVEPDAHDPEGRIPLPNIEDPKNLVTSPGSGQAPAGAFPIPLTWPARMRFGSRRAIWSAADRTAPL